MAETLEVTVLNLVPGIVLGLVSATLIAALMHVVRGRTLRDLFSIWMISQAGFWLGHIAATLLGAPLYMIGDLQIVAGVAGSGAALALAIVTHR